MPRVLAASAKIADEHAIATTLTFRADGIARPRRWFRIRSGRIPQALLVAAKRWIPVHTEGMDASVLLHF